MRRCADACSTRRDHRVRRRPRNKGARKGGEGIDLGEKSRPDSTHASQSGRIQEGPVPNSIAGDSFGDGGSDTGQRIDLRSGCDIEIQLAADIPRSVERCTSVRRRRVACAVPRRAARGVAAPRADGRGRILRTARGRPMGARRTSTVGPAPTLPRFGRGVGRLHLVFQGRLLVCRRAMIHCPRDADSGAEYRDGRDKDQCSMLGLDRHTRNLRPAPCTPAPNCFGVYHLIAVAKVFGPTPSAHCPTHE